MQYRRIAEITPYQCPYGGPDNCVGCKYYEGIRDISGEVFVYCTIDEDEKQSTK